MSEIECPYCGYSYEYDDVVESDEWFEKCEQCRKEFKVRQRSQQSMDQSKAGSRFRRLLHENPDRRAVEGISKPKERTQ